MRATAEVEIVPFLPPCRAGTSTDWEICTCTPDVEVNVTPSGTEITESLLFTKSTVPLACTPAIVVVPVAGVERLSVAVAPTEWSGMMRVVTSGFLTCGEAVNRKVSCNALLCGRTEMVVVGSAPTRGTPTGNKPTPNSRGTMSSTRRTTGTIIAASVDRVKRLRRACSYTGSVMRCLFFLASSVTRCSLRTRAGLATALARRSNIDDGAGGSTGSNGVEIGRPDPGIGKTSLIGKSSSLTAVSWMAARKAWRNSDTLP